MGFGNRKLRRSKREAQGCVLRLRQGTEVPFKPTEGRTALLQGLLPEAQATERLATKAVVSGKQLYHHYLFYSSIFLLNSFSRKAERQPINYNDIQTSFITLLLNFKIPWNRQSVCCGCWTIRRFVPPSIMPNSINRVSNSERLS
jgi:hypothetical protein